jgi:uncharacterized membrane protein
MTYTFGRVALAALMIFAGVLHFVIPKGYARMVPRYLPAPFALVYISGVCEILGGAGILVPMAARFSAWGLIALYIAVFPANLNMAVHHISPGRKPVNPILLWLRLPLQLPLIYWAWLYT